MSIPILTFSVISGILLLLISILVIYIIIIQKKYVVKSRSDFTSAQSRAQAELDTWYAAEQEKLEQALQNRREALAQEMEALAAQAKEQRAQQFAEWQQEIDAQREIVRVQKQLCEEALESLEKQKEEKRKSTEQEIATLRATCLEAIELLEQQKQEKQKSIENEIASLKVACNETMESLERQKQEKQKSIEVEMDALKTLLKTQQAAELKEAAQFLQKQLAKETAEFVSKSQEQRITASRELDEVRQLLDDFRKKQQVVNEEIMRRRQVEEQADFYRIVLTDQDKEDIHYLLSIINNIKNKQLLYKLIWSEYIQKPFGTMLKNITGGKEIKCVIYKITNLKTQEIYIGKTKAEVSKRWTEHVKTSLNIGTIARSNIHIALFGHWDEFSFEVLEQVEDESQLSTREKFYINFYQSNIYGYNMNSGG